MLVELRVGIEESIPWNQPTTKIPLPQNRPFPLRIGRNWPAPLPSPCCPFLPFSIDVKENGEQEHDREELRGKKLEHGKEDLRGVAPSLLPLASRAAHLPCLPPRRAVRRPSRSPLHGEPCAAPSPAGRVAPPLPPSPLVFASCFDSILRFHPHPNNGFDIIT